MSKIAIYPGTFDPITLGHLHVVERGSQLFDRVIVGVAPSERKNPWFSLETRIQLAKKAVHSWGNVDVHSLEGVLVDFAKHHGASWILKGVRSVVDFDYEILQSYANHVLNPAIETVFIASPPKSMHVSGTIVRELAKIGGDLSSFVPNEVEAYLKGLVK